MVKLQKFVFLPLLFITSIATATAGSSPSTLNRRGVSENCDPLLGGCGDQWPLSPITSSNPFIPRRSLRRPTPPFLVPSPPPVVSSPPPVVSNPSFSPLVASPPPLPVVSNPSFSPLVASPPPLPVVQNPSFSPLVASPPPPHKTIQFSPPADVTNPAPPLVALSFSPPADDDGLLPEFPLLPPLQDMQPSDDTNPPAFFLAPPLQKLPPDLFNPAPPLVPTVTPPQVVPVDENPRTTGPLLPPELPDLPRHIDSPPAA